MKSELETSVQVLCDNDGPGYLFRSENQGSARIHTTSILFAASLQLEGALRWQSIRTVRIRNIVLFLDRTRISKTLQSRPGELHTSYLLRCPPHK